jgi:hypothetical protein
LLPYINDVAEVGSIVSTGKMALAAQVIKFKRLNLIFFAVANLQRTAAPSDINASNISSIEMPKIMPLLL